MSTIASKAVKGASGTLSRGAKRDPELYILLGVMSSAFGLAGYYFGRKPTSGNSESTVAIAPNSKPWETENSKNAPKDAPSALNVVVVPSVNLPKMGILDELDKGTYHSGSACQLANYYIARVQELHDKYNKWGKDDY
ncbi:hypothetical protein FGG08_001934 [Glutinoglossum americanum]|uniref:Uncharacterized protein n=1 Tax=Glutinoglossum americanum TaxID=1670608 RepID=A0A9P8KZN6_9PEZI|nr:hypothetical protein FGG08_001934 [Glutinoglossum americanum]